MARKWCDLTRVNEISTVFDVFGRRQMGVLLHPSSLPGPFGIGDLGPEARRFVDWLVSAGVRVWQVLPLCPPGGPRHDIPYASCAALAGNPQLISLEDLVDDALLSPSEARPASSYDEGWALHERAVSEKSAVLDRVADRVRRSPVGTELEAFRERERWAVDAARFLARKHHMGGQPWWAWPDEVASRAREEMDRADRALAADIDRFLVRLFLFERQWTRLRAYARDRGVALLGDVPIYVMHDSADVWLHREGWRLDAEGQPIAVSGAPPDVFSADGQVWGGPLYDWAQMADDDYDWWRRRLKRAFAHFDAVRIDHFRAFAAYWEIPVGAETARDGRWVPGPGRHFFDTIRRHLGPRPLCVEDLGFIDDDVHDLVAYVGAPGMKILHYGFGDGPQNPHLPHNVPEHAVVYPGNHDNDTTMGWWRTLDSGRRTHVQHYLGRHGDDIAWDLNRAALSSAARLAVIQMQDLLSLDTWARMNDPVSYARPVDQWRNWRWRLKTGQANEAVAERIRFLGHQYGRVHEEPALIAGSK